MTTVVPSAAYAQIYAWRDGSGNLVLSNAKKEAAAETYAVANGPTSYRTTRRLVSRKAAEFESLIVQHATANDVSPDLVRAVIQAESAFNPNARSQKGAMGLMQLMPSTASEYKSTTSPIPTTRGKTSAPAWRT
jgi:soluble lytic murein transglycosylase-like protein